MYGRVKEQIGTNGIGFMNLWQRKYAGFGPRWYVDSSWLRPRYWTCFRMSVRIFQYPVSLLFDVIVVQREFRYRFGACILVR